MMILDHNTRLTWIGVAFWPHLLPPPDIGYVLTQPA